MKRLLLITSLCVLFASTTVLAVPTQVFYTDGPQDPLFVPEFVHELGTSAIFPQNELIEAVATQTDETVCLDPDTPDDPAIINALVSMKNLTGIAWKEVWYVADSPETRHTNYDGWVGGMAGLAPGTAFRIDRKFNDPLGIHHPLIAESMTQDGIFEIGETWNFVIQDYSNVLGLSAAALDSIGVPSTGNSISSGSIIAVAVPEPITICMLGFGALSLLRKRK